MKHSKSAAVGRWTAPSFAAAPVGRRQPDLCGPDLRCTGTSLGAPHQRIWFLRKGQRCVQWQVLHGPVEREEFDELHLSYIGFDDACESGHDESRGKCLAGI